MVDKYSAMSTIISKLIKQTFKIKDRIDLKSK
jgi:hypothetical protein